MASIPLSCNDHLSAGLSTLLEAIKNITVDMGKNQSTPPINYQNKEST